MTAPHDSPGRHARAKVIVIIVAVFIVSLTYRLLAWQQLEHTSLVFIGLPAILAIVTVLMRTASVTGLILQVITVALLLSGVLLGEFFVCILFTAPLFYLVGIIIGQVVDFHRRRSSSSIDLRAMLWLALIVTPASLEGVVPGFSFDRHERVTVTRLVHGSPDAVAATLSGTPRFDRPLPRFLQLGFPRPGEVAGSGLKVGDTRHVQFIHGHHPGTLVLAIEHASRGAVDFVVRADDSYITHWLSWQRAEVRWREAGAGRTEVSWTLSYRRRLDPAWYFKPLERYGVYLAAGYLLDTLTTPDAGETHEP